MGGDEERAQPREQGPAVVVSASHTVAYLVQRLAGDLVSHRALLPDGATADAWSPDASVVIDLQRADRIALSGAGLEGWVTTVSLPGDAVVNLSRDVSLIEQEGKVHSHGKDGEHSHPEIDPRVWTDPMAYRAQAVALHASLASLGGLDKATLDANLAALTGDLDALHTELQTATSDLKAFRLIAAQPDLAYLFRRYGLDVTTLTLDSKDEGQQLRRFEQATKHQAFSVLLWSEEPEAGVRARFGETVRHVVLDDLSMPTVEGYDYIVQARFNASVLAKIIPDDAP